MRADNSLGAGIVLQFGHRGLHSKRGEEMGGKKTHREVLPVPTAVLWLDPHTPWAWRKCIQVLGSTSLQSWGARAATALG